MKSEQEGALTEARGTWRIVMFFFAGVTPAKIILSNPLKSSSIRG
jgi:hypothetical protein